MMKKDKIMEKKNMRVLEEVDTILDIYVNLKIRNVLGIKIQFEGKIGTYVTLIS